MKQSLLEREMLHEMGAEQKAAQVAAPEMPR